MSRKSTGFTLLEMMVVVAIMGILTGLAGPSFTAALRHRAMDRLARNVASNIYKARSRAIMQRKVVTVKFDSGFTYVMDRGDTIRYFRYPSDPKEFFDDAWTISQTDKLFFNANGLLIDGNGVLNSRVVVRFTDTKTGDTITLTVNNAGSVDMGSGA